MLAFAVTGYGWIQANAVQQRGQQSRHWYSGTPYDLSCHCLFSIFKPLLTLQAVPRILHTIKNILLM